jgi:hypothetical protein
MSRHEHAARALLAAGETLLLRLDGLTDGLNGVAQLPSNATLYVTDRALLLGWLDVTATPAGRGARVVASDVTGVRTAVSRPPALGVPIHNQSATQALGSLLRQPRRKPTLTVTCVQGRFSFYLKPAQASLLATTTSTIESMIGLRRSPEQALGVASAPPVVA